MLPRLGLGELIVLLLVGLIFIFPLWKIPRKAGYSQGMSLLFIGAMAVPILNIIVLWVFASAEWPVLQELKKYHGAPPQPAISVSRTPFQGP